jgi:hypothetical protein
MVLRSRRLSFSGSLGLALLLLGLNGLGPVVASEMNTADASNPAIDPDCYRENVERLASDEMEGRRVGRRAAGEQ